MADTLTVTTIDYRGLRSIEVLTIVETTHYMPECDICHEAGWHDTFSDGSIHHPTGLTTDRRLTDGQRPGIPA